MSVALTTSRSMLEQPESQSKQQSSSPRARRGGLVSVPPPIQQIVSQAILEQHNDELGNPTSAEITDAVITVVASVLEMQITPQASIDPRAQSRLGRRVIELISDEVMRRWREYGLAASELPLLLLAIERVREASLNGGASLATHLGGDGLKLLVEVAHDMHSPLASILCLAETMQRGESGPVTELQRRQLGLICTAALGLSSVGSDIVDLERSDLLLEPKPAPFSVTSVLESVRDIVRPIAEVKQLAVRLEPPTVDERLGHPVALRRVLLNLTTNALKFTERGFVELSARETKPGFIEFGVRDTGRGIEPSMLPTLFDAVRHLPRGHAVRGNKLFSNTGLGLTICRKLAEAMDSELHVDTNLGRGTRFFFELELPECASRRNSDPGQNQQETTAA
ncbi:MAG TPA: HAMP domain-containing sensor histidine kinase [Gemmatimonadales bacterium]|nr:HAMP domain-containing sensor histidine kinase [Gemmatimonadales bacterium]